jgi:hypothetical protein
LDQLATPLRRNGEHISAILERERKHANDIETMSRLSLSRGSPTHGSPASTNDIRKSRSMSQLAGTVRQPYKLRNKSGSRSPMNGLVGAPMRKTDTSKSMSQLDRDDRKMAMASNNTAAVMRSRKARSERLRQQVKEHLNGSSIGGAGGSTASSAGAIHKMKFKASFINFSKTKFEIKSISKFLAKLLITNNISFENNNNNRNKITLSDAYLSCMVLLL